jgi:hypothetical protein
MRHGKEGNPDTPKGVIMSDRAVAYLTPGPHEDRQIRAIYRLCEELDLTVTTRATDIEACARLIAEGHADVVVAASDPRNGLRHLVTVAGGRVEFARTTARLPTLADWLRRAAGRGVTPHQIAKAVGEDTTDVSRIMRELGLNKPPGSNN